MGDVYLALLSPPEVRAADQVVQFSTRKELALLICPVVSKATSMRAKTSHTAVPFSV